MPSILFQRGARVRMEYPQNSLEDRLTGRDFVVMNLDPPNHVIVADDGGERRVSTRSLIRLDAGGVSGEREVTAKEILSAPRAARRKKSRR